LHRYARRRPLEAAPTQIPLQTAISRGAVGYGIACTCQPRRALGSAFRRSDCGRAKWGLGKWRSCLLLATEFVKRRQRVSFSAWLGSLLFCLLACRGWSPLFGLYTHSPFGFPLCTHIYRGLFCDRIAYTVNIPLPRKSKPVALHFLSCWLVILYFHTISYGLRISYGY